MSRDLIEFTRRAFEAGASREKITEILSEAGWARSDVDRALDAFAPVAFPIPVPLRIRISRHVTLSFICYSLPPRTLVYGVSSLWRLL